MGRMKGLRVNRISLVDKPATGIGFQLIKCEGGSKMKEETKELLGKFVGEGVDLSALDDMEIEDVVQDEVAEVLRRADEYGEELPKDVREGYGVLAVKSLSPVVLSEEESDDADDDDEVGTENVEDAVKSAIEGLASTLDKTLAEGFSNMDKRIERLETVSGKKKSLDEEEDNEEDVIKSTDDNPFPSLTKAVTID